MWLHQSPVGWLRPGTKTNSLSPDTRHGGSETGAWGKIYNGHNNKHTILYGQFPVSHSLVLLTKFMLSKFCVLVFMTIYDRETGEV